MAWALVTPNNLKSGGGEDRLGLEIMDSHPVHFNIRHARPLAHHTTRSNCFVIAYRIQALLSVVSNRYQVVTKLGCDDFYRDMTECLAMS